jgi:hypothetical protein
MNCTTRSLSLIPREGREVPSLREEVESCGYPERVESRNRSKDPQAKIVSSLYRLRRATGRQGET